MLISAIEIARIHISVGFENVLHGTDAGHIATLGGIAGYHPPKIIVKTV
jgi:hypothetical protein